MARDLFVCNSTLQQERDGVFFSLLENARIISVKVEVVPIFYLVMIYLPLPTPLMMMMMILIVSTMSTTMYNNFLLGIISCFVLLA